jgi:CheY-like chemotaxis protein
MIQVVLVERDPALAQLYFEELSEAGFTVRVKGSLEEACADLRTSPAHILVTDANSTGAGPAASWLPRLRQVHQGPVLMLAPPRRRGDLRQPDLPWVAKTSDLAPLISSLRGQTAAVMWSRAAAHC